MRPGHDLDMFIYGDVWPEFDPHWAWCITSFHHQHVGNVCIEDAQILEVKKKIEASESGIGQVFFQLRLVLVHPGWLTAGT